MNDLRSRIRVQTDGKLQTGRDVVIAALLGAEEFGFSTAPLVSHGLHHDAQVPPEHLPGGHRDAGSGAAREVPRAQPEHVINFFFFIAEQVREYMAKLGFRTFDEMIGRVDMLEMRRRGRALEGARPRLLQHPLQPA